jgi:CheY-like chemotaxis protein
MSLRKFTIGRWAGLLALSFPGALAAASAPVFTPEEQQWIKAHPVVYFAADDGNFPLSYTEGGTYRGVVAEYVAVIARKSGLHFERHVRRQPAENKAALLAGKVDMLPFSSPAWMPQQLSDAFLFTGPYFTSPRLIITRADEPVMLDSNELSGKVVSVFDSAAGRALMLARLPRVMPLFTPTVTDALDAVEDRRAYAGIGAEITLQPLLRGKYRGLLSVSGSINDAPLSLHMAVRKDERLLFSIVEKSLESLSVQETDAMRAQAIEQAGNDVPTPRPLPRYGLLTIVLLTLGPGWLAFFAWRCWMAKKIAKKPRTPRAASETPGAVQARVLVVEDDPGQCAALTEQLKMLGIPSAGLHDGLEALAQTERQPPALILMDCHMPGLDGYETTRRIRQREAEQGLPHVPIIAVSAASDAGHLKACMDAGMDGVLTKPLHPQELQSILGVWLDSPLRIAQEPVDTPAASVDIRALYQASMDEDVHAIEQAMQTRHAGELVHFAHRIKGAALMLGAREVADAADRLEQAAKGATPFDGAQMECMLRVLKEGIARYFAPVDGER